MCWRRLFLSCLLVASPFLHISAFSCSVFCLLRSFCAEPFWDSLRRLSCTGAFFPVLALPLLSCLESMWCALPAAQSLRRLLLLRATFRSIANHKKIYVYIYVYMIEVCLLLHELALACNTGLRFHAPASPLFVLPAGFYLAWLHDPLWRSCTDLPFPVQYSVLCAVPAQTPPRQLSCCVPRVGASPTKQIYTYTHIHICIDVL
jgi:hypothetical protein